MLGAALLAACNGPAPAGSKPVPSAFSWDELRTRPLNLPTVAQAQPCPVSPSTRPLEDGPMLRGAGPVYNAAISVPAGTPYKIAFFASSSYTGPVLVRGPVELPSPWVPPEQQPVRHAPTRGCYAWQVDGTAFSRVIIFEAT
jgi:hypothetical protein